MSKTTKPIDVETIRRYQDALNYMLTFEKNGFVTSEAFNTMRKSHKISTNALTGMTRCGYLKGLGKGQYKVVLPKLDPIHAKNVIDVCKDIQNEFAKRRDAGLVKKQKERKNEQQQNPVVQSDITERKYFHRDSNNVKRYQQACTEILVNVISTGRIIPPRELKINGQTINAMVECGMLKKVNFGTYEPLTKSVSVEDAEKVLNVASKLSCIAGGTRKKQKKSKQKPEVKKSDFTVPNQPIETPVKIHKKEGTIEVSKDKFLTAEVKPKQTRTRKPKRVFSILWGLIKFNY